MANYIKPTLNIVSNAEGVATDPGPLSFTLNLSTTPSADANGRLTVDNMKQDTYVTTSSPVKILDGHDIMTEYNATDIWTPGTDGCFLYMKNEPQFLFQQYHSFHLFVFELQIIFHSYQKQ